MQQKSRQRSGEGSYRKIPERETVLKKTNGMPEPDGGPNSYLKHEGRSHKKPFKHDDEHPVASIKERKNREGKNWRTGKQFAEAHLA